MSLIIDALKKAQQLRSQESRKAPFFRSQGYPSRGFKTRRWLVMVGSLGGIFVLIVIFMRFLHLPPIFPPEQTVKFAEEISPAPVLETVSLGVIKEPEKPEPIVELKPSPAKAQKEERGTNEKKSDDKLLIKPPPEERVTKVVGDQEKVTVGSKPPPVPSPPVPSPSIPSPPLKEEVSPQPITFKQESGKERVSDREATNLFNLGVSYHHQGERLKAIQAYSKAIEIDPAYIEALNNLGMIYQEMGDLESALRAYLRSIEINPKYEKSLNNMGILFYLRGEEEKALETFLKLLAINPNHIESHFHLGTLYKKRGQPEKGIESYQKALAINSLHGETHYNLGLLYEQMEKMDLAIHHYREFIQISSSAYPELASKVRKHIQLIKTKGGGKEK